MRPVACRSSRVKPASKQSRTSRTTNRLAPKQRQQHSSSFSGQSHFKAFSSRFIHTSSVDNDSEQLTSSPSAHPTPSSTTSPAKDDIESTIATLPNYIDTQKQQLLNFNLSELQDELKKLDIQPFRAKQIFHWIYQRGATSFSEMTTLSKQHQQKLSDHFNLFPVDLKYVATATDGTQKYVVQVQKQTKKNDTVECVFIPRIFHQLQEPNPSRQTQWDIPESDQDIDVPQHHIQQDDIDDLDIPANVSYDVTNYLSFQELVAKNHTAQSSLLQPDLLTNNHIDSNSSSNGNNTNAQIISLPRHKQIFIPDFSQFDAQAPMSTTPLAPPIDHFSYQKGTVCVSSQIGCSLTCAFCHTGTMPKNENRNLHTGEIVGQIMGIKHNLHDFIGQRPAESGQIVSNTVFMGQGEPGYNWRNVFRAIDIMMAPEAFGWGRRHITVSTSGVVPVIEKLAQGSCVNLAISLHAVNDELRDKIMPINHQWPLSTLIEACRRYPGVKKSRKITFEYVMLNGINDSDADARELLRLTKGIPSLINLIPFNPWPGSPFTCSSMNRIRRFQEVINDSTFQTGIRATLRKTMGTSESAACGTLNSKLRPYLNSQLPAIQDDPFAMELAQKQLPHLVHDSLHRL